MHVSVTFYECWVIECNTHEMHIREKRPRDADRLEISKFQFTCDSIDKSIPEPLPQKGHFFLIVGQPRSGKTNLILNLLCKKNRFYNCKYDRVFLFSPSTSTFASDYFRGLPDDQKYTSLDQLEKVIARVRGTKESILILIDDLVASIKKNDESMMRLIFNRRHLTGGPGASVILTTQVYNKLPLELRKNASHVVLFKTTNKKEIKSMSEELANVPSDTFENILRHCFAEPYSFLYMDVNAPASDQFYRKWNKLRISGDAVFGDVDVNDKSDSEESTDTADSDDDDTFTRPIKQKK